MTNLTENKYFKWFLGAVSFMIKWFGYLGTPLIIFTIIRIIYTFILN